MTDSILAVSLHVTDGSGVVGIDMTLRAGPADVWRALTDPPTLAQWHAEVTGDLRHGGDIEITIPADEWSGTGRIETCEAPRHFAVTTRETKASWQAGVGMPPFDERISVSLTAQGTGCRLHVDIAGIPLAAFAAHAAGWHLHAEALEAFLAGRPKPDAEARWSELEALYAMKADAAAASAS